MRRRGRAAAVVLAVTIAGGAAGCGNDSADDDGGDGGGGSGGGSGGDSFVADPPAVYVAKVKNILVGLPPTDAELAQVTADPRALFGLIDGWMATPEYQHKMMVFFELAFQQTQISAVDFVDLVPPQGLGVGRGIAPLIQNVRESFARTVLALIAEGRPVTEAFTTRRLMMTPALMELYAFLDARRIDNAGNVTDSFARAHPRLAIVMGTAQGPIPISETLDPASPNFMHWYNPDIATLQFPGEPGCSGLDPIQFRGNAQSLHALLYGEIPNHPGPQGNCNTRIASAGSEPMVPSDFTTWKMITIRQPRAGEDPTVFYDLPALRAASELVVATPRVGFFSTPAFFANWPTNASNQMRVTLNQALIVATGTAIDGTDTTAPDTTPGLDAVHAAPNTACFTCHRQLDPTRSILSSSFSWFYYPQTDPALIREPGLFAYRGVVAPVRTLDDFAQHLASHPLVPQAWGQKLCYYVNSAPCSADDPEFIRVIDSFVSSGLSWNVLVRELLASPLTTNANSTATAVAHGGVVAVSRRDHLCAALDHRLGFVDICQLDATVRSGRLAATIAQIVSGMPSDGYGRGATAPVLPNQPTLFYRAALENVCSVISAMVVDAAPNPGQPSARRWSSAQPEAAIAEFVAVVMALPASDPRAAQASQILTSHFTAAGAAGATPTDALRSTFVAACLSPSFIGIGM